MKAGRLTRGLQGLRRIPLTLGSLRTAALRRALQGEPVWFAVAIAVWLVQRERSRRGATLWTGRLDPGQTIVLSSRSSDKEAD